MGDRCTFAYWDFAQKVDSGGALSKGPREQKKKAVIGSEL